MTLEEVSRLCHIRMETLQLYQENGLLPMAMQSGTAESPSIDLQRLGLIHSLTEIGVSLNDIRQLFQLSEQEPVNREGQIRILKKYRFQLLDEIHSVQQCLDKLDFLIHQIKMGKEGTVDGISHFATWR